MIDWKLLGNYIRILRINKGWSQGKLGRETKYINYFIQHVETNDNKIIGMERLINLCTALDINICDLLFLCKTGQTIEYEEIIKENLLEYYNLNKEIKINWKQIRAILKQTILEKNYDIVKLSEELKISSDQIKQYISESDHPIKLDILNKIGRKLYLNINELLNNYRIYNSKDVE